ncbi:AbiJ-related protein [Streptomyces altiplanensis]
MAPQQLTVVTRQRLLDFLVVEKIWWWGALDEVRFLERLYDLDTLEGDGYRRPTAREDIWQHCINNDDWLPEWVFTDARFGLSGPSPQPLLNFLAEMLHPVVRRDPAEVERLAEKLNGILAAISRFCDSGVRDSVAWGCWCW